VNEKQLKSLLRPAAYPEPAGEVRLIQTHVSWIFLAGEFAYKVKKPVDFGFLNFSTLDRRRFYCQEEMRLNNRLCPRIYLGVVPLRRSGDGLAFHGDGEVVDYAVKMVRLPEELMADRLLERGELSAENAREIAAAVASFHGRAERGGEIAAYGALEEIRRNWEENFRQAEEFSGKTLAAADLRLMRGWVDQFMAANEWLFASRVEGGFIRECDGDLHLENISLDGGICIFDCIEFNNRFRFCDTAADLAFLLMDLEFHGRRDLAEICLHAYLEASEDRGMLPLVGFYKLYRAFIRGKVESMRIKDPTIPAGEKLAAAERGERYFRLARGYILRQGLEPCLIVLSGLSGSGKSAIGAELSMELGVELLSSDILRKELAGIPPDQRSAAPYGGGIYTPEKSAATYGEMYARAGKALSEGRGVIIDATCRRRGDRERLRELAAASGVGLHLFLVECPEKTVRKRLEERQKSGEGASDAGWEVYLRQKEEFETILESEGEYRLDGSAPIAEGVDRILTTMGLLNPTGG